MAMLLLVVEDNPYDVKLIEKSLNETFVIGRASTLADAKKFLSTVSPDVMLVDLKLPDTQGYEAITELHKLYPDIPIVACTGTNEASDSLQLGADDFVLKDATGYETVGRSLLKAMSKHKFKSIEKRMSMMQTLLDLNRENIARRGQNAMAETSGEKK